jgi:hypothetical protein
LVAIHRDLQNARQRILPVPEIAISASPFVATTAARLISKKPISTWFWWAGFVHRQRTVIE